ncbi:hypothetical protein DFH27DRAFT_655176 [Peziza echinospora]|nr:hypothetical protein DFH27DRAFT_655176 [Peziza echinospora]
MRQQHDTTELLSPCPAKDQTAGGGELGGCRFAGLIWRVDESEGREEGDWIRRTVMREVRLGGTYVELISLVFLEPRGGISETKRTRASPSSPSYPFIPTTRYYFTYPSIPLDSPQSLRPPERESAYPSTKSKPQTPDLPSVCRDGIDGLEGGEGFDLERKEPQPLAKDIPMMVLEGMRILDILRDSPKGRRGKIPESCPGRTESNTTAPFGGFRNEFTNPITDTIKHQPSERSILPLILKWKWVDCWAGAGAGVRW